MISSVVVNKDKIVRISGPAKVKVKSGKVLVVGSTYTEGEEFVIHRLRSYGIKALEDSVLEVTLGSGASVEEPSEGEEVIDEWLSICNELLKDLNTFQKLLVFVLGPIESGKTTLSAFITNYMIQHNVKTALIDGDVGQADIAIPATVSLTIPESKFLWQRELSPRSIRFVGCISPQYCQSNVLTALLDLINEAINSDCKVVVVNTDGWLSGVQALEYKLTLIRWSRPTHVLVLDEAVSTYLRHALPQKIKVVYVPKPAKVKERKREDRRKLRADAYRSYFSKAKDREVSLANVRVINSIVLSGVEIPKEELLKYVKIDEQSLGNILYVSRYANILNIVVSRDIRLIPQAQDIEINIVRANDLKGILVGIMDPKLSDVAVGIIKDINFEKKTIRILTPWNGDIEAVVLGKVRISLDTYEDNTRLSKCLI